MDVNVLTGFDGLNDSSNDAAILGDRISDGEIFQGKFVTERDWFCRFGFQGIMRC